MNRNEIFNLNHNELIKIIETLPIAAFIKDFNNNIKIANREFFKLFNFNYLQNIEEISNIFYSKININKITEEDLKILETGEKLIIDKEMEAGEEKKKFKIYKTLIENSEDNTKQIAVFIKNYSQDDITQEKNNNIIATLTHDLKTPAVAQIKAIELLLNGKFGEINESQRNFLNDILYSCNSMLDMLINMLWLYKFDNKKIAINISSFDVNELIKDIFKENKLAFNSKKHIFKFNHKALRIYIKADKMHIKRIISNLIMNAVNHSRENSVITVETDLEGSNFIFRVKNEGEYLSDEVLKCIFDKNKVFTQKTDGLSTGLGLYLSNSLLELNGGRLLYSSLPQGINMFGFTMSLSGAGINTKGLKSAVTF